MHLVKYFNILSSHFKMLTSVAEPEKFGDTATYAQ